MLTVVLTTLPRMDRSRLCLEDEAILRVRRGSGGSGCDNVTSSSTTSRSRLRLTQRRRKARELSPLVMMNNKEAMLEIRQESAVRKEGDLRRNRHESIEWIDESKQVSQKDRKYIN